MKILIKPSHPLGFTLVELLVTIAIVTTLASISSPIIIRQISRSNATRAVVNAKNISAAMVTYEFANGSLPSLDSGDSSSNDMLRTLFQTSFILNEKPFWAKTALPNAALEEPDGNITGENALAQGENIFSYYVKNNGEGISMQEAKANTPVMITPILSATGPDEFIVETESFGGRMVLLTSDRSVTLYNTDENNMPIDLTFIDEISDFTLFLHE